MRMARVCQADGAAIAAAAAAASKPFRDEKHEIVVARSRRDRTCFLSPFFASSAPHPSSSGYAIKSDLTSIYLRIFQRPRRPPLFFFFFLSPASQPVSVCEPEDLAHEFRLGSPVSSTDRPLVFVSDLRR